MENIQLNFLKGETDKEIKEYLIKENNINFRLLIILDWENDFIEFKINEMIFIPKYIYYNKYNFKELKSILNYNDIDQIINLLEDAYANNKISIIIEDLNIKLLIRKTLDNSKEQEYELRLERKGLDNNDKLECIINEINSKRIITLF